MNNFAINTYSEILGNERFEDITRFDVTPCEANVQMIAQHWLTEAYPFKDMVIVSAQLLPVHCGPDHTEYVVHALAHEMEEGALITLLAVPL